MARFYRTSATNNMDYMYQLPTELMVSALQTADSQIDAQSQQLSLFGDAAAKVQFLEPDRARASERINYYKDQVNQLSSEIMQNPQDWRKKQSTIRNLGRELTQDMSSGELAAIQGNYSKYNTWLKSETDRFNKGDITADWLSAAKTKYLADFGGTNYNRSIGTYNQLNTAPLAKYVDINKRFDDYLKEVKASSKEDKRSGVNGMYIVTTEKGEERVDADGLRRIAAAKLAADSELMSYMKQGSQLGVIKDPVATLSSALGGAVGTYAYSKMKNSSDIKENGVAVNFYNQSQQNRRQEDGQAHDIDMLNRRQQADLEKEARDAKRDERMAKMKHNLALNPNAVELDDAQNQNPASGTSTSTLQIFDKDELNPDILRTQLVPQLTQDITAHDVRIAEAQKAGNMGLVSQLQAEKQMLQSQKNTAQGLVHMASMDYYKSNEFRSLSQPMQALITGYNGYLNARNLPDNEQNRRAYANQSGPGGLGYNIPTKESIGGIDNRPRWNEFNSAMNKSTDFIQKHTRANEVGNQYNATGIDVNLGDQTISGLLNQAMNSGNLSFFGFNTTGGTKMGGGQRGVVDYNIDSGKWFGVANSEGQFSIPELMRVTGAKSPSELFSKVTVMPSTNGNLRLKVRFADEINGKTLGKGSGSYHQIEGLPESKELTIEVNGTSANSQVYQRLNTDPNPEVRRLAYTMSNTENANFLNNFIGVAAPGTGDMDRFGTPAKFGYGQGVYEVSKARNGQVKVDIKLPVGDGVKTFNHTFNSSAEAQDAMLDFNQQLNTDYESVISSMVKSGVLK